MKNLIKATAKMKAHFLISILMVISTAIFLFSNSKIAASNENAKILFEAESHDFGKVEAGHVLEYSFKFTNEGNKPLIIEKVQPSCGCTGATVGEKTEFAEGESGEIKITFNTQGRSGHQQKQVTVHSNDSANSQITLRFSCDIADANSNK